MVGKFYIIFILFYLRAFHIEAARILVYVPTASISHQVVFRPLTQELARRGHDVTVITTDPAFPKGKAPANLTEIDVHDAAYSVHNAGFAAKAKGNSDDIFNQITAFFELFHVVFEAEVNTDEVQAIIKGKQHFDLLILEACVRPALIFSHIFKAPVILYSSLAAFDMINEYTGTAMHPLLYPSIFHQKINNLTLWEKAEEIYKHYYFEHSIRALEADGDKVLRRNFGADIPPLKELRKNVDMVFMTEHHIWDNNRPVPPSVLYLGGIYPTESNKELPKDLQTYLDASEHGVIYMSFGTNVNTSLLPKGIEQIFVKVLSRLPYDILLKWDTDYLTGAASNIKLFKWLPQQYLLRHPKIKLFITQGGLQSTGDAIAAGVPLLGMPMLGDQWYNVEQYVRLKIGIRLDIESLTEKNMFDAINTVINDESYRLNIISTRKLQQDEPQTPIDRAIWWTEHVIRHKGARHLRSPAAMISYWDYFEIDVVIVLMSAVSLILGLVILVVYKFLHWCYCLHTYKVKFD